MIVLARNQFLTSIMKNQIYPNDLHRFLTFNRLNKIIIMTKIKNYIYNNIIKMQNINKTAINKNKLFKKKNYHINKNKLFKKKNYLCLL